jgi:peroxiredoxin Q/BCP
MLKIGDLVSNNKFIDNLGNSHSFEDYRGSKIILFFYPRANTPGCTAQACNLRDNYKSLIEKGYVVFGISGDNVSQQNKFSNKYSFQYLLIADNKKKLINAFGVWGPKKFQGREYEGIHRTTFLIDEKGIITRVINKVKTKDHAIQILEEI